MSDLGCFAWCTSTVGGYEEKLKVKNETGKILLYVECAGIRY